MTNMNNTAPRGRSITWARNNSAEFPYEIRTDGHHWQIRINDFPAEPMYTLLIDGKETESFDDWPTLWKKP